VTAPYVAALLAVLAVSLVSLIGALGLAFDERVLRKTLFVFVSLAVGALYGGAFIHLIPEAMAALPGEGVVGGLVLGGILAFFALEKFLHWHHSHAMDAPDHDDHAVRPLGPMVLVADGVHNFTDGIIIAGSFMISMEVGLSTTLAIALHEIPQEIGDFALLIHAGYRRATAIWLNFASSLVALLGAGLVFVVADIEGVVPGLAAVAAGGFIYIAGSDLVPELHKTTDRAQSLQQLAAILVGVGLMLALVWVE